MFLDLPVSESSLTALCMATLAKGKGRVNTGSGWLILLFKYREVCLPHTPKAESITTYITHQNPKPKAIKKAAKSYQLLLPKLASLKHSG